MRTIFSINVLKPTTLQVIFRLYITTSLYIFWYSMPNVILFAAMRSKREYMYTYTGSKYWEIICHKTWNTLWSESNRVSGKHLVELKQQSKWYWIKKHSYSTLVLFDFNTSSQGRWNQNLTVYYRYHAGKLTWSQWP